MASNRIVMLVPGIMGSVLSYNGQEIWSEDFSANYRLLANSAAKLTWQGNPANAEIMERAFTTNRIGLGQVLPFLLQHKIWTRTIRHVEQHPKFGSSRLIKFGYDWRDSLRNSARRLGQEAAGRLGSRQKIVFIAHSMGGLLVRVAIGQGDVDAADVDRVIQIGSPLRGAPSAFSALHGTVRMPFLPEFMKLLHGKRSGVYLKNFHECTKTFPSAEELLPHEDWRFIRHVGKTRIINPLKDSVFDATRRRNVKAVHSLITRAGEILDQAGIPSHCIYTDTHVERTETEFRVARATDKWGNTTYEIRQTDTSSNGDGTVPSQSARGTDLKDFRAPVIDVAHPFMCEDRKVVGLLSGMLG